MKTLQRQSRSIPTDRRERVKVRRRCPLRANRVAAPDPGGPARMCGAGVARQCCISRADRQLECVDGGAASRRAPRPRKSSIAVTTIEDDITFRPLCEGDLPLLHDWIHRPHVAAWWGQANASECLEDTRRKYLPRLQGDSPVRPCVALLGGEPIGFIQSYTAVGCSDGWWEDETDPGVRGIDQFLCDGDRRGQGTGSRMVAAFVRQLFDDPSVTKVQTDPDPTNARAIRCYEKAGLRPVGTIATPDGPALLMVIERHPSDEMQHEL